MIAESMEAAARQFLAAGQIPAQVLAQEILADRDRLLEEIYELRRFKALAVDLIECQSSGGGEMTRSKSALLSPAEVAKAEEPLSGPRSATCACRVWDRRARAQEAHLALREGQGGQIAGKDGAKFADIAINDTKDLDAFYFQMLDMVEHGNQYRMRVVMVA
jgi:hypothetical protein